MPISWSDISMSKKCLIMGEYYAEKHEFHKALKCFFAAGENPEAIEKLGECFYMGLGVEKDINKAKNYFKRAADAGNTDAMCNYAWCINDNEERYVYYKKAAEKGCIQAMRMIALMIENHEIDNGESAELWYEMAEKAEKKK